MLENNITSKFHKQERDAIPKRTVCKQKTTKKQQVHQHNKRFHRSAYICQGISSNKS
jgi:hypothetical protein